MRSHPEFTATVIRPIYFVEIDFEDAPFRANTSDRNITVDDVLYYGVSTLGKIGDYTTTSGVRASAVKLTLSGIPGDMLAYILAQNTRNKNVKISVALADEANQLITPLIIWFNGGIDSMTMDIGKQAGAAMSASSRLLNWARSVNSRYTNEDQQFRYPGDKGLQFIANVPQLKLRWGG